MLYFFCTILNTFISYICSWKKIENKLTPLGNLMIDGDGVFCHQISFTESQYAKILWTTVPAALPRDDNDSANGEKHWDQLLEYKNKTALWETQRGRVTQLWWLLF